MLCTTEHTLKLVQANESHASLDADDDDSSLVLYRDPSRASAQSRGSFMSGTDLQELVWTLQSHSQLAAFLTVFAKATVHAGMHSMACTQQIS
jgi:hypothetical protein